MPSVPLQNPNYERNNIAMTTTQSSNKPTGLLLCGGGAKAAFQIGALDVLRRRGLLDEITGIAGCSAGALNMVLYAISVAQNDPDLPIRIWNSLRAEDLLSVNQYDNSAIFSRSGLVRLMRQLPLELVSSSPIWLHVSVYNVRTAKTEFHILNGLNTSQIMMLLLASSAIPAAYPPVAYQDGEYIDGGMTMDGYLCIQPLYAEKHQHLLMIAHDPELSLYGVQDSRFVRVGRSDLTKTYPDCKFLLIKPSAPLGGLLRGTLNFDPEKLNERMQQGMRDTDAILRGDTDAANSDPNAINARLASMMQRLFPTAQSLAKFVNAYRECFATNIATPTLGGKLWYNDVFAIEGWRLQHHRTKGLRSHYRIIDSDNIRRAWILDPDVLLDALQRYEKECHLTSTEEALNLPYIGGNASD